MSLVEVSILDIIADNQKKENELAIEDNRPCLYIEDHFEEDIQKEKIKCIKEPKRVIILDI